MAKEEKLDIEDIKDPEEDLDLDEAISEGEIKEDMTEETEEAPVEEPEKDILEESQEEQIEAEAKEEKPKPKKEKKPVNWKIVAIVLITLLVTGALVMGGLYFYSKNKKAEVPKTEETTPTNNVEINVTPPAKTDKGVYVNATGGLNLREEPSTSAKILILIPFGTKLDITETQGTWYKTTHSSQTGWVDSTYTQVTNPLVYQSKEHGYELTFPANWSTYKITTKTIDGTPVDYIALATTDKNWADSAAGSGYASMFAISIYTKEQWEAAKVAEGPKPTYLGEKGNNVFAWSQAQAMPSDLTAQYEQIKSVIATFKVI